MFLIKILLPLFLFVNVAYAQSSAGERCENIFRPTAEQTVTAAESSLQFHLAHLLSSAHVPENIGSKVLDLSLRDIEVRVADIEPHQIKLKRKFDFQRLPPGSKKKFLLIWPSDARLTAANESAVNLKLAEIAGAMLFKPATRLGVYKASSRTFVNENVEALTYKLYLENYATPRSSTAARAEKSAISRTLGIILRKSLPLQKTEIEATKLDPAYARLLDLGGPSALFSYLSKFQSVPMAVSYWVRHAMNGGIAIATALALYLAPTANDAWNLMRQEGSISVSPTDQTLARGIIENFDKTDLQMIQEIKRDSSDKQEAAILADFLAKYKDEQNAPHP